LIQSATTALTGGRLRWHKLHRAGLVKASPPPALPPEPIAPAVDTWPPVLDQIPRHRHAASGRATARPPGPRDPHDMPSAGSPPGGGVYTG
jgi:hypothetical protein